MRRILHRPTVRWVLAIIITVSAAVYQRMTGPTYPLRGDKALDSENISYRLPRSHGGSGDLPVSIQSPSEEYTANIIYRRYKANDTWTRISMNQNSLSGNLTALLPHQPPAGKLEYFIVLKKGDREWTIPERETIVVRFKGYVPKLVLVPHVLLMFFAMLLSTVSGLEAIFGGKRLKIYTWITTICLFTGGMILGPIVQKFAFGAYWTGIPFGYDLTDNKLLFSVIFWLIALFQVNRPQSKYKKSWVIAAAVVLLLIYSIPHSVMGSELDYKTMEVKTG
ncbi:MAG: hypothetical protein GF313_15925 [Caldithrix sp.]|nr:hypothetical protein [Caldithrix sp.]